MAGSPQPAVAESAITSPDITDLLEVLDLQIWKAAVSGTDKPAYANSSICVMRPGAEPEVILQVSLAEDGGSADGVLLASLQSLPGRKLQVSLIYRSAGGADRRASALIDDPFGSATGVITASETDIGQRGNVVLRSSNYHQPEFAGAENSVAIYVRNE